MARAAALLCRHLACPPVTWCEALRHGPRCVPLYCLLSKLAKVNSVCLLCPSILSCYKYTSLHLPIRTLWKLRDYPLCPACPACAPVWPVVDPVRPVTCCWGQREGEEEQGGERNSGVKEWETQKQHHFLTVVSGVAGYLMVQVTSRVL